jgi:hypothetical protein
MSAYGQRAIERLIATWRKAPLKASQRIENKKIQQQWASVARLIKSLELLELPVFDPFRECDAIPLEKHTRDFLAEILRPEASHGLSPFAFSALLDVISDASPKASTLAARIRAAWNKAPFQVAREVSMTNVRPDVVVQGDHFMVAFEIKRRFGIETIVRGQPQTRRLRQSVFRHAAKAGISRDATAVVLMSPIGFPAQDGAVIPISAEHLFEHLSHQLIQSGCVSSATMRLIRSFTDFLRAD